MSEKTPINKQPKLKLNSGTLESAKRRLKKPSPKKHSPLTSGRSRKVRRNRSNKKRGFQRRSSRSTKN